MHAISPWEQGAAKMSPNGEMTAKVDPALEVAMGAPTMGDLKISNGIVVRRCNPSLVWSEDSRYLAVPQWTNQRMQRLIVVDTDEMRWAMWPELYRVLQLESFAGGLIVGTDSPVHMPTPVEVDADDVFAQGEVHEAEII